MKNDSLVNVTEDIDDLPGSFSDGTGTDTKKDIKLNCADNVLTSGEGNSGNKITYAIEISDMSNCEEVQETPVQCQNANAEIQILNCDDLQTLKDQETPVKEEKPRPIRYDRFGNQIVLKKHFDLNHSQLMIDDGESSFFQSSIQQPNEPREDKPRHGISQHMVTFADQVPERQNSNYAGQLYRVHEIQSYKKFNKMTFKEIEKMIDEEMQNEDD